MNLVISDCKPNASRDVLCSNFYFLLVVNSYLKCESSTDVIRSLIYNGHKKLRENTKHSRSFYRDAISNNNLLLITTSLILSWNMGELKYSSNKFVTIPGKGNLCVERILRKNFREFKWLGSEPLCWRLSECVFEYRKWFNEM